MSIGTAQVAFTGAAGTASLAVDRGRRVDAVSMLTLVAAFALLIPSRLVVRPLGSAGTPAEVVGVVLLALWLGSRITPSIAVGRGRQPVRLAVGIFSVAVLASYATGMLIGYVSPVGIKPPAGTPVGHITAPSPLHGFLATEISAADRGLLLVAALAGAALFTADGVRSRERLDVFLGRLVWLGAVVAAIGIVEFFTSASLAAHITVPGLHANADFGFIRSREGFNRAASTAIDPIEFSVVTAALFPVALHRALYAPRGRKAARWIPALLILTAVPMAVSRSGVLVLAVALTVMFLGWSARRRLGLLVALPIALIAVNAMKPGLIGAIGGLFTRVSTDPSTTARMARYPMALHVISQSPLTGRGMSTFVAGYYTPMDNQLLLTGIETGVIGLLALLTLFAVGYFTARGVRRRCLDLETRDLAQALAASVAGLLAGFATFDAFSFPMCAMVTFLVLGCCGALWRLEWRPTARYRAPSVPTDAA